jgi:hypothetical protein
MFYGAAEYGWVRVLCLFSRGDRFFYLSRFLLDLLSSRRYRFFHLFRLLFDRLRAFLYLSLEAIRLGAGGSSDALILAESRSEEIEYSDIDDEWRVTGEDEPTGSNRHLH